MELSRAGSDKCDTWDRPLDDRDDTCVTVLASLCVSVIDVHTAKTTQTHKDKPSKSLEQDRNHGKEINMPKDNSWLSKQKGGRHVEETHGMTFISCNYACH